MNDTGKNAGSDGTLVMENYSLKEPSTSSTTANDGCSCSLRLMTRFWPDCVFSMYFNMLMLEAVYIQYIMYIPRKWFGHHHEYTIQARAILTVYEYTYIYDYQKVVTFITPDRVITRCVGNHSRDNWNDFSQSTALIRLATYKMSSL